MSEANSSKPNPAILRILLQFPAVLALPGVLWTAARLAWTDVLEGQWIKQSFAAQMIESWKLGQLDLGFPLRFFLEPHQNGVIPWAEEFPLYHAFAAWIAGAFELASVTGGRALSFVFLLVYVQALRRIFLRDLATPQLRLWGWVWIGVLALLPGVQLYSAAVMPDFAALACIAMAVAERERIRHCYLWLMAACAFKYFAVFSVLAFLIGHARALSGRRQRLHALSWAGLSVAPTVLYLILFLTFKIPNPIQDYQEANGYGHWAGPFLFQAKFYLRWILWVWVKVPSLPLGILALVGIGYWWRGRRSNNAYSLQSWAAIHMICLILFSLVFASSFYVHDYYALPYLVPLSLFAFPVWMRTPPWARIALAALIVVTSSLMVAGGLKRRQDTQAAAHQIQTWAESKSIGPRQLNQILILWTDEAPPVIPNLTQRTFWMFDRNQNSASPTSTPSKLSERWKDPRTRGLVILTPADQNAEALKQLKTAAPELEPLLGTVPDVEISGGSLDALKLQIWSKTF